MPVIYKCPGCGAAMEFDSDTQKLKCSRCQTSIDVKTYEKEYASLMEEVAVLIVKKRRLRPKEAVFLI